MCFVWFATKFSISAPNRWPCTESPSVMTAAAAGPLRFMPKLTVIGKFLQRLVVTRWLDQRQHPLQYRVFYSRYVPDIKINRVQQMPQMQFRIVIETAAAKPLVAICNRPRNHISHCIVIKVQVERDRIV